jgi:sarcosine oxidase subunit beta
MADTADVVVVGGGVNGVSIAHALAARGVRRVVLCEKEALASGASGRSSALVRIHYTNEWDARLAWASFPVFRDWSGIMAEPPVFRRTGFLTVVAPRYAEHLRRNVDALRAFGVPTEALGPDDVRRLQPFMNVEDIGAAAYEPESGYASPADTVEGYRRNAEALGAQVRQWTRVTRILASGGRVRGVETAGGRIDAPVVVVAAGAWSTRLCREVGVTLPARPKTIDTVLVTRPPALATPHMTVIDNVQGTYLRPESDVLTIVGVPSAEWDVDPDLVAPGLPPGAGRSGRGSSRTGSPPWSAPPWRGASGPSTATATTGTRSSTGRRASRGSTWRRPSAGWDSRSRPRSGPAWRS